jgi:alpha-tubulin suppressor-like RCC1 family protein
MVSCTYCVRYVINPCISSYSILIETGDLTCTGNRLGTGLEYDINSPSVVQIKPNAQLISISCGLFHNLALLETGEVYSWGCGLEGQLGHGNFE